MELRFVVEGKCVPWMRTSGYQGRRITPKEQRDYQGLVGYTAQRALPKRWPLDMRYAVELRVYEPDARRRDLSNELKTIEDACIGIVWGDDSQIDALAVVRRIDRQAPRVEVTVATMTLIERETTTATIEIGGAT